MSEETQESPFANDPSPSPTSEAGTPGTSESPAPVAPFTPTEESAPVGDPAATYFANTGDGEVRATVLAVLIRRLAERIRRAVGKDIQEGRADRLCAEPLKEVEIRAESLADRLWSGR